MQDLAASHSEKEALFVTFALVLSVVSLAISVLGVQLWGTCFVDVKRSWSVTKEV